MRTKTDGVEQASLDGSSALERANGDFHSAYGNERWAEAQRSPVLVILGDEMTLVSREQRHTFVITSPAFHAIKSVAHAPIAVFVLLQRPGGDRQDRLHALRDRLLRVRAELDDAALAAARTDLELVLEGSLALLESALAEEVPACVRSTFAQQMGPVLLRLTAAATAIQLHTLDEQTERALATLAPEERDQVHVVVAGVHQARARSLAMQYFQKRLCEPPGAEMRITYAEAVTSERAALELVGTQRLDRLIARAFFGDARRLQRDILGDAAAAQLQGFEPLPLGGEKA